MTPPARLAADGWEDGGPRVTIDPDDGEAVASEPGRTDHLGRDRGDAVTSARAVGGDVLEVRTAEGTLLWPVDALDRYEVAWEGQRLTSPG